MSAKRATLPLLALPAAIAIYLAFAVGGAAAGFLALAALAFCAVALLRVTLARDPAERDAIAVLGNATALALPGALVVYFSFKSGGYFAGAPAFVASMLALVLSARAIVARRPFEGIGLRVGLAAGALALYALWTLLSGSWSDSHGRAFVEFDRALLYLLVLLLFGSFARDPERIRWMLRGLALGIVVVCVVGLATRVLPDVFPIKPTIAENRLSYPLTYWNSLGILTAMGIVLCLHLASSTREPPLIRILGAAALPVLGPTLLFTFSRGAILAGTGGLLVYAVLARPRALASGLLAAGPTTAIAVVAAYHADLLATRLPTTPAAVSQGHDLAPVILACIAGAAVLRAVLFLLDERLMRFRLPDRSRLPVVASAWGTGIVATVVVLLAVGAPGYASRQYDRFVHVTTPKTKQGDLRTRLVDPANNGRIDEWKVATGAFTRKKLDGYGAGTYGLQWDRHRPQRLAGLTVADAHSLYAEVLGELGLVGLILLAAGLLTILTGIALRARGANRTLYAALFAAALTWAVHAGVDWDWEMPAVCLLAFAVGGAALARRGGGRSAAGPRPVVRVAAAIVFAALAVPPTLLAVSQHRLNESVDALTVNDDCGRALDQAHSSLDALGFRAEPYEVIGYCELRRGRYGDAVRAMQSAVDRDPGLWEQRYGLALARGAAELDPRPAAQAALERNPFEPIAQTGVRIFGTNDPSLWRARALTAQPSVSQLGRISSGEAGISAVRAAQPGP